MQAVAMLARDQVQRTYKKYEQGLSTIFLSIRKYKFRVLREETATLKKEIWLYMLTKLHGLCLLSKCSVLLFYTFSQVVVRGRMFILGYKIYWAVNKNLPVYIFLMLEAKRDRWPSKINSS